MTREFAATPAQLFRAHTDAELFARWIGPDGTERQDRPVGRAHRRQLALRERRRAARSTASTAASTPSARTGIVQTFTFEGMPDAVCLETMTFEDLGDGRTRSGRDSLFDSFEARDGMLSSGMEVGVNDGYAQLDRMLAAGEL